jgi:pimeloyl-ACP methyl ester carboxylesterase
MRGVQISAMQTSPTRRTAISRIGAAAALALAPTGAVGPARAQSGRKTFVLIHGALIGGWCWRRVADLLEKKGREAFAPTLTGLGERSHLLSKEINLDTHVADIVNVIKWQDIRDCCLVAHSYAGFPASAALEQIGDRVSSIVWLDALKPENGQTVAEVLGPRLRAGIMGLISKGEIGFPPAKNAPPTFVNAKDAALVVARTTPHPIGTLVQPIRISGALERVARKTYIRLPKYQAPNLDKVFAECKADESWTAIALTDTGHLAMLDAPERLVDLLLQAA